jgi:hypothetical protein
MTLKYKKNKVLTILFCICVSVDDMRANTEYSGYSPASPVIQWFWEVAQGFSKEDKARLLQFVTGTSKVFSFIPLFELNFYEIFLTTLLISKHMILFCQTSK